MRTGVSVVVCVLLSAVGLASIAFGKVSWQRTYGGQGDDAGFSIQQTSDGGFIIAGYTSSFGAGEGDVYLVKTNAQGDTLWTKTYGGTGSDDGRSVQQTTDGGYVIAGSTHSDSQGVRQETNVYLIKTNASGDTLWTRMYGEPASIEYGRSVQQTTDGGYIITGDAKFQSHKVRDVYLIKTNAQGDTLWTRTFGGDSGDAGYSVRQTTDGGYVVAASTECFGTSGWDAWLIKTNAAGDTLWTKTYGGPNVEESYSVRQTADGGYIIVGYTASFGAGREDIYLIKTNAQGDTLWTRTYGGPYDDEGYSVQQTTDGGYIIAGTTKSFGAGTQDYGDVCLIRTDSLGDTLWTRTYGGEYDDGGYSVAQTSDSGYVIAGSTSASEDGDFDVYLIRADANFDVGPVAILSPPGAAESARVYQPRAVVRGFGLTSAVFPVTMEIGAGYAQTIQETLAARLDTVVFPAWTAGPMGSLAVTCFTSLAGDEDPTNDTIRGSVQVVPPPVHDIGAIAVLTPSGNLRTGETVVPRARLKNFGNAVERFFNVRFRIGTSYNRAVNVSQMLYPDSTVVVTFAPWVAASGQWAVSCSTMLESDVNRANDKASSSVRVVAQALQIEPDQSDRLEAGKNKRYQFYALIQGDTGGVVEVARPIAPTGWSLRLCDATGAEDLTDTDADGIPDLGYVAPGESGWFSLDVTTPSGLSGDTASLAGPTFLVAGHLGNDSLVADTAVLSLTLIPTISVHNFPNPFSGHTAFVIGLPDDGKASLTIYTRAGQRVCRVLVNADMPAGIHVVNWDGVNDNGRSIAPGTYEYLLDYVHADKTERIRKRLVVTRE